MQGFADMICKILLGVDEGIGFNHEGSHEEGVRGLLPILCLRSSTLALCKAVSLAPFLLTIFRFLNSPYDCEI